MAALLLGRMLTRPDMGGALQDFLAWAAAALPAVQGPQAPFLVPGILKALAITIKLGHRWAAAAWLLPLAACAAAWLLAQAACAAA